MDDTRILTEDETRLRRADQAASRPGAAITLCNWRDCPQLASHGPFCRDHHHQATGPAPGTVVAHDLTDEELEQVRHEIEAKAAPLFLLAMDWIVRGQLTELGLPQLAGPITITRTEP